nr:protein NYNRIN-like [Pelodiscus sinensis]|eukprot:XP_014428535.1 protein NYNRIN-like [Pelodiscus sinensis]
MGKPVKTVPATRPPPLGPFLNLQMDFIQLPKCQSFEYVLVIVCLFSGWVEAYPCKKADAITVAKKLLNHYIPSWGIPLVISSDRGTHFTGQIVQKLTKYYSIRQALHCPRHPESAGAVERRNGILKNKLAKICEDSGLTWVEALPIALMSMRATPNRKTGLSPHEIACGRPMRLLSSPDINLADAILIKGSIVKYCQELMRCVQSYHSQVKDAFQEAPTEPCHKLHPGD